MTRIIALANQKGGVGKTTTTLNLGAALAERGRRVLLIDLDPQSNLTMGLGLNPYEQDATAYQVLLNADRGAGFAVQPVREQLDLIPATLDMAAAEVELMMSLARESMLRKALHPLRNNYDYILIDPPPSLGLFTLNALVAATEVLIPLQPHPYALKGLTQLRQTITLIQKDVNPGLQIGGILFTQVQRNNLAVTLEERLRGSALGTLVYRTTIPQNVRITESSASGLPVIEYDRSCAGATAYLELAEEVDSGTAES
ncbi:MAG: ParA family protein [Chloroflexaceae bacterium]|nr:ParA family protein [Chloroflexaceae bacterium]